MIIEWIGLKLFFEGEIHYKSINHYPFFLIFLTFLTFFVDFLAEVEMRETWSDEVGMFNPQSTLLLKETTLPE